MRRGIGATLVTVAIGVTAIAGCMLFTGSTDGYEPADSGATVEPVDSACQVVDDSGICFVLGCASTAECMSSNGGGDAGVAICCVGLLSPLNPTAIGSSCAIDSCQVGTVQSCDTNTECSGGASCVYQSCSLPPNSVTFRACGLIPGCARITSSSTDAGEQGG
jgi:hypothetical protein